MCILIIRTWQPCLHMRCTATDRCVLQVSNPGVSEYDCPDAHTIYLDDATDCPCPVCPPRMVVQRLEDLLREENQNSPKQSDDAKDASTRASTETPCGSIRERTSPGSSAKYVDVKENAARGGQATVHPPNPVSPMMPAKEILDGWIEHTEARRDAHDAQHRGRGPVDEPSLAAMTNEEVRELLRKELAEDGILKDLDWHGKF